MNDNDPHGDANDQAPQRSRFQVLPRRLCTCVTRRQTQRMLVLRGTHSFAVPFQIIRKINDQIWVWDCKILKSRFGVYTYHIVSTVIISVPAVWIAMSQGVSGRCGVVGGIRGQLDVSHELSRGTPHVSQSLPHQVTKTVISSMTRCTIPSTRSNVLSSTSATAYQFRNQ